MSEQDFKKLITVLQKFVLWGTISSYCYISNFSNNITIKSKNN